MNLKWKDIYNSYKQRRYCEITGIKKEDVEIVSNSFVVLKEKKYLIITITLIFTALLVYTLIVYTLRNDIKALLLVLVFFIAVGFAFFIFNYYKLKCTKDGLYIRFGTQEGTFPYDRVKSVYLSRFNDYNIVVPSKTYSIVIRYLDNAGKIKELSFPNYFIGKEGIIDFLENFNVAEAENKQYVYFERFKRFKKIAKTVGFVLLVLIALSLLVTSTN